MFGVVRILRRIGGGTPELDRAEISQKTRNGYTVLGMLILIVATMSSAIAAFTWASVMHAVAVGIGVGVVWFVFSASLNYMMAWIIDAARGRIGGLIVMVVAFLLFGALISAVNTNFVMLWMLDTEIRQTLQAEYQAERGAKEAAIADAQTKLNRELGAVRMKTEAAAATARGEGNAELSKAQAEVDRLNRAYQTALSAVTTEVDGRGNSRQVGDGSRARQKRAEADALKGLLDVALIRLVEQTARLDPMTQSRVTQLNSAAAAEEARLQSEFFFKKTQLERNIAELDAVPRDGFINRDLAMWGLVKKDPHFLFIFMALFFLIESMVGLVKILMGKTDYHLLLEAISAQKMKVLAQQAAEDSRERRQAELAAAEERAAHKRRLRELVTEEHNGVLDAENQRLSAIEAHVNNLKSQGVGEEALEAERRRLLKEAKRNGFLRVVPGGRR